MTNIAELPDSLWMPGGPAYERDTVTSGSQGRAVEHPTTKRVVGTLRGSWPDLGHVRIIPSTDADMRVTDVNAFVRPDGTLEPVTNTR